MGDGIANFETILYDAAQVVYNASKQDGDPGNVNFGPLNYNAIQMTEEPRSYDAGGLQAAAAAGATTQQIYFSSTYENNTDHAQEHVISAKDVKGTMEIKLRKGAYFGTEQDFGVHLPIDESAAPFFGRTVTLQGQAREMKTKESTWSTDDKITVPGNTTIKAEIVVEERHYPTTFNHVTQLKGKVGVVVTNPSKNNAVIKYMEVDMYQAAERARASLPEGTVELDTYKKTVKITTEGDIEMRYGIDKRVVLTTI